MPIHCTNNIYPLKKIKKFQVKSVSMKVQPVQKNIAYTYPLFFPMALRHDSRSWPPLTGLRHHTHWTYHKRYYSFGRAISPTQRPLVDNTQPSEKTSMPPTPQHTVYDSSGREISQTQRTLTTHSTQKRQISITPEGFKSTIPASEPPQTHALDRAAISHRHKFTYLPQNG
jgi:hypothetical protein